VYFAFDRSTGRVLWKYDTRQDGFVGALNHHLYRLSSRRIEGVPRGLSRSGSTLFVGTLQGAVLAYEYPQPSQP
jgi:hypothetical protein